MNLTAVSIACRTLLGPFRDYNGETAKLALKYGGMDFACLMRRIGDKAKSVPTSETELV